MAILNLPNADHSRLAVTVLINLKFTLLPCWGEPNIAVTRGNLSPGQLIVAEQELGSDRLRPETRRVER